MSAAELSYFALRGVWDSGTDGWWATALGRADVPAPVAALLRGRVRVELSAAEADATLAWAAGLQGWADADPKPLLLYRP
jgi:hypothetical protein